jgi:PBP1b-binding outer membrane lipoprotein LpoB
MRTTSVLLSLAAATILFTGCGSEKPARTAVAQATESVEKIRPDASQYAPQELAVVDATLARMQQDLANEKYSDVVKTVPQLNTEFATAVETANSTKTLTAAAQNEWQELNTEVPKTVEELDARVETLSAGALPKDITKETLASAKTELEGVKTTWAEATAAATAGDLFAATDKGRSVQMKTEKLKEQLGLVASTSVASL